MGKTEIDRIQHELETEANELFPGWLRRVELLQHDDAPWMEPGQLMPRLVFKDPADRLQDPNPDPRKVAKAGRTFKLAVGPGLTSSVTTCWSGGPRSATSRSCRKTTAASGRPVTSGSSKTAARPSMVSSPT